MRGVRKNRYREATRTLQSGVPDNLRGCWSGLYPYASRSKYQSISSKDVERFDSTCAGGHWGRVSSRSGGGRWPEVPARHGLGRAGARAQHISQVGELMRRMEKKERMRLDEEGRCAARRTREAPQREQFSHGTLETCSSRRGPEKSGIGMYRFDRA